MWEWKTQEGILELIAEVQGRVISKKDYRLTPGVAIVPASLIEQISDALKRNGAKFKITKVWV